MKKKIIVLGVIISLAASYFYFDLGQYLSLESLKEHQGNLKNTYEQDPWGTILIFIGLYVLVTGLSLPGATILTLAGGSVFGFWMGTFAVSLGSTLGATCAFLVARTLMKNWVQEKFGEKLKVINKGIETEGAFYLFALRLVPAFPFFVINLVMGLTPIKVTTFFFVSQIGMLAGTFVYVNAGTQLATMESLSDIASPKILLSFAVLGIFPILAKKLLAFVNSKKTNEVNHG